MEEEIVICKYCGKPSTDQPFDKCWKCEEQHYNEKYGYKNKTAVCKIDNKTQTGVCLYGCIYNEGCILHFSHAEEQQKRLFDF